MSDYKERIDAAIKGALSSRAGNLLVIARSYLPELTNSGYLKVCPRCHKGGNKFSIRKTQAGHWAWGCYNTSCNVSFDNLKASRMGDTLGFIMEFEGCDRNKAVDILLKTTNTPNPRDEYRDKEEKKATKKKPKSPTPASKATPKEADISPPNETEITQEEEDDDM